MGVIVQGAPECTGARHLIHGVLARFARYLRESRSIDQRSGVVYRRRIVFGLPGTPQRRGAGGGDPVAQVVGWATDRAARKRSAGIPSPARRAAETGGARASVASLPPIPRPRCWGEHRRWLVGDRGRGGSAVTTGERVSAKDISSGGAGPAGGGRAQAGRRIRGERAAALELALEALYLASALTKVCGPDRLCADLVMTATLPLRRHDGFATLLGVPAGRPLAPPVDLRDALEPIGQDVMAGASPRRALSELLRSGHQGPDRRRPAGGRVNAADRSCCATSNLDGTAGDQKLLDEAVLAERKSLARARRPASRAAAGRASSLASQAVGAGRAPLAQRAGPRK